MPAKTKQSKVKQSPASAAELSPLERTRLVADVSVTERGTFKTCRRRWHLTTIENLEPRGAPALELDFGTALHAGLEKFHLAQAKGRHKTSLTQALGAYEKSMNGLRVRLQTAGEAPELLDEVLDLQKLGTEMLKNYPTFDRTAKVQLGKIETVEGVVVEGPLYDKGPEGYPLEARVVRHPSGRLLVPIVDPGTQIPLEIGTPVDQPPLTPYLSARLDLSTLRESPRKGPWVVDHKSTAKSLSDKGLEFDDQGTGYCYTYWRLTGVIPRGMIYNALIKNAPKDPRYVQSKKKGGAPVLSTAKDQLTTADLYREALKEDGYISASGTIKSENHAECLESLLAHGWDRFFLRMETTRNLEQLLNFERRLYTEWEEMRSASTLDYMRYPNPSTFLCSRCPVGPICLAMEDGSDYEDIIESRYQQAEDRKEIRA